VSSLCNITILETTANPIAIYVTDSYGYLILDSNMSMPEALVTITIERTHVLFATYNYDISMDAVYTFLSPDTQNATIGLACPNEWFTDDFDVQILDNQLSLPYVIHDYDDLISENETQTATWDTLDFFTFNCSLDAGILTNISVRMDLGSSEYDNGITFRYFVATAHSWSGNTYEVVTMNLINLNGLRSFTFAPTPSSMIVDNPSSRTAIWNLNMSAFEEDSVRLTTIDDELYLEAIDFLIILAAVSIPTIIIILVVFIRRKS